MTFLVTQWKLILIALLLALLGLQQVRIDHAHAETIKVQGKYDHHLAQDAEAAFKAERAAREIEEEREQLKNEIIDAAEARVELAKADAAAASDAAAGLRKRLASYVAAVRTATNPSAPVAGEATDPIAVFAVMLGRVDDAAGKFAAAADTARIAGLACQEQYESLQPRKQVP